MCIVIAKNRNVLEPNYNTLRNCFDNNPHGAGFAFEKKNKVSIVKGFMDFEQFWNVYKSYELNKNNAVLYHFRIATLGSTTPENCHPFPISSNIDDLKKIDFESNHAFVHNGILNGYKNDLNDLSDSQQFVRMLSALKGKKDLNESLLNMIDFVANESLSRFAILERTGKIRRFGEKWIKDSGLYFSNDTYLDMYKTGYTFVKDSPDKTVSEQFYDYVCELCQRTFTEEQAQDDFYRCLQCGNNLEEIYSTDISFNFEDDKPYHNKLYY